MNLERLENRELMTTITIGDATAVEGDLAIKFIDTFVPADSGGLSTPRYTLFGPDKTGDGIGELYVASQNTDEVLLYDGESGSFLSAFVTSGSGGLGSPWAMAFGPDGNLFVTGALSNNVLRYDGTTGVFIDAFVPTGSNGLNSPKGILFDHDGLLYVSSSSGAGGAEGPHQVLRFQGPNGASPGAALPAPGQSGAVFVAPGSGGLSNPNGLAIGPDGNLYVANTFVDSINRYDGTTGAFLDVFVPPNDGGLDVTSVLAFRPDGYLYVSSQATAQVLRYDAYTGAFVDAVASPGSGDNTDSTSGFDFDADGNLYLAIRLGTAPGPLPDDADEVLRYGPASQIVFTVSLDSASAVPVTVSYSTTGGTASAIDDFESSTGTLTFAPGQISRTILIQTHDNPDAEPTESFFVNLWGEVGATIADAQGVATIQDNDTKFYVVDDSSPDRTYEYAATGGIGENYGIDSGNTKPRGASSTAAGDKTWVVDANKKVYVYDTDGGLRGSWTAGSLSSSSSLQVEGIATNGTDVWIVDAYQDKVFRYANAAGRLSGSQNAASSFKLNNGNSNPKDVVTDGVNLWVVNDSTIDKVFKYTLTGSLVGSWTITGAGASPTGITLDPSGGGDLWVVDNGTDRVYQFANARARTSGSLSPLTSFALAAGNANPQGIADPPASDPNRVVSPTRAPISTVARSPRSSALRFAAKRSPATPELPLFIPQQPRQDAPFAFGIAPTGPSGLRSRLTASRRRF